MSVVEQAGETSSADIARGAPRTAKPIKPMLAVPGSLPVGSDWCYEVKWDGVRVIAQVSDEGVTLTTRNGNEVGWSFRELTDALGSIPLSERPAAFDCEVICFGADGRPSFSLVQKRLRARVVGPSGIESAARLAIFDILERRGEPTTGLDYDRRRAALAEFDFDSPLILPPRAYSDGASLLQLMRDRGMEGVVAKRRSSKYQSGRRSSDWVKVKCRPRAEFVVGGFTAGGGSRAGTFGALAVGAYDETGRLNYVGNVGSGFNWGDLAELTQLLDGERIDDSPFADTDLPNGLTFVAPCLVVEVEFQEFTRHGRLRQPVFVGLRSDKQPLQVTLEGL